MRKTLIAAAAFFLVSGAATAATKGKDSDFAMKAAQGGMAEVDVGKLAANQGSDPKVKEFGQKMTTDHGSANEELKSIASKDGIDLPSEPSKKQKSDADKLGKLQGDAFDKQYAKMMVKDHEEDVALFKKEASSGQDPDLKAFAQKTLPTLEEHLRMAKALPGNAGGKSTRQ